MERRRRGADRGDAAGADGALAPLVLGERNSALQWAGIGVGFSGVVIFIGADSGVTGAAPWVYGLPMLATASLTFITLWERWRAAGAGLSSRARPKCRSSHRCSGRGR